MNFLKPMNNDKGDPLVNICLEKGMLQIYSLSQFT